jgi:hypothetical protein
MPPQAKKVELKSTRMEEGDDVHLDGEWLHSPTQKKNHPASVTDLGRTQSEKKHWRRSACCVERPSIVLKGYEYRGSDG